jgi:nitric-oxide synthase
LNKIDLFLFFTLQREVGVTLTPPTGQERTEGWCGLEGVRELKIKYDELDR